MSSRTILLLLACGFGIASPSPVFAVGGSPAGIQNDFFMYQARHPAESEKPYARAKPEPAPKPDQPEKSDKPDKPGN